jgi:hypothetical protein
MLTVNLLEPYRTYIYIIKLHMIQTANRMSLGIFINAGTCLQCLGNVTTHRAIFLSHTD